MATISCRRSSPRSKPHKHIKTTARSSSRGTSQKGDTSAYTIPEIIISPDAKGDAYTNNILYTHSSDFLTIQEIFNVGPCLLDACSATDLSDLFKPGWIPNDVVPEPRSILQVTA